MNETNSNLSVAQPRMQWHESPLIASIVILVVSFLSYGVVLHAYFVADDFLLIADVMKNGLHGVIQYWAWGTGGFLRPVITMSFALDYAIWGLNPLGYHITNTLVHGLAGIGVFLVARHYNSGKKSAKLRTLPFLTALLFVVMASHSESVAWISGRTDLFAAAFALFATAAFLTGLNRASILLDAVAISLLAAALLAKESVIILPLAWTMMYVFPLASRTGRASRHALVVLIASYFVLFGYFFLRLLLLGRFIGGYGDHHHIPKLSVTTLQKATDLVFRTYFPAMPSEAAAHVVLLFAGVLFGIFATAILLRRHMRTRYEHLFIAMMLVVFLLALVPVVGMGVALDSTTGERLLYLPSVFACLLFSGVLSITLSSRRSHVVMFVFILFHLASLQVMNHRWLFAGQLSKQIASEVSRYDPARTVVLNLPDSYRGVWILRHGLTEAASLFLGKETTSEYNVICRHQVSWSDQRFSVDTTDHTVSLIATGPSQVVRNDGTRFGYDTHGNLTWEAGSRKGLCTITRTLTPTDPGVTVLAFLNKTPDSLMAVAPVKLPSPLLAVGR